MSFMKKTIRELAPLLQTKALSPVELAQECLQRIEQTEPVINAFITVTADRALKAAASAETEILRGRYRGPLHGIPYSAKDLYMTRGIPTTAGSAVLEGNFPATNAAVIDSMETAGAVLVGKNNLHEFAYGTTSENDRFGPCRNPWNSGLVTGGSSGGSAASVAVGSSAFSLGTDTGGSIRIPASFCGVVGIKPTYGRVSKRGVIPLSWSMDHTGPIARSVWDAAAVLTAMAGYDPDDVGSAAVPAEDYTAGLEGEPALDLRGLKIGICPHYYEGMLQPPVEQIFDGVLRWFEQQGAQLRELSYPDRSAFAVSSVLTMSEAYTYHERNLENCGDKYGPSIRYRLEKGQYIPASVYVNAQRLRQQDRQKWAEIYREIDIFLSPTVVMPPFPIGAPTVMFGQEAVNPRVHPVLMLLTSLGDFNGHPVLSLPCGFTADGLPIGFQIQGRPFGEAKVFQVAYAFEQAHPEIGERKCDL
ncbi:MAG: amidase [Veillonellaceae bacterium]|nr:amidase [Veillonellaceae bacterium]